MLITSLGGFITPLITPFFSDLIPPLTLTPHIFTPEPWPAQVVGFRKAIGQFDANEEEKFRTNAEKKKLEGKLC